MFWNADGNNRICKKQVEHKKATSSEFGSSSASVVGLMSEWKKDGKKIKGTDKDLGGTMRLGSYEARLKQGSLIAAFIILLKFMRDIGIDMKLI